PAAPGADGAAAVSAPGFAPGARAGGGGGSPASRRRGVRGAAPPRRGGGGGGGRTTGAVPRRGRISGGRPRRSRVIGAVRGARVLGGEPRGGPRGCVIGRAGGIAHASTLSSQPGLPCAAAPQRSAAGAGSDVRPS